MGFDAIESGEERVHGFRVSFLRGSETGAVDTVIDVRVYPFVRGFDFFLEVCGIQIDILVFLGEYIVELDILSVPQFLGMVVERMDKQDIPRYKTS